jgi:hypothetical protein
MSEAIRRVVRSCLQDGDTVELREAAFDTVGTVAVMREGHVKVEWNTGQGLLGKTTMLSVSLGASHPSAVQKERNAPSFPSVRFRRVDVPARPPQGNR